MALSRIQTAEIADNAVTTGKVDDATVIGTDIVDGTIVDSMVATGAAIAHTKCAVGSVASLDVGTSANKILQLNGSGVLPALDGTQLTGIVSDFTPQENQLARLGLHIGAVEQLAKFNMIDQVIDDYEDATGVVAYNGVTAVAELGDASSSGHTITSVGGVVASTTQTKVGTKTIYFPGGGSPESYLLLPASSDFAFGTGAWTIEAWLYITNLSTRHNTIFSTCNPASQAWNANGSGSFAISLTTNDKVWFSTGGGSTNYYANTLGWPTNQWAHFAVTHAASSTDVKVWKNGTSSWTVGMGTSTFGPTSGQFNIGTYDNGGDYREIVGYVDEYRISNTERYTSTFTPSTTAFTSDANTMLLLHGDAITAVANTGSSSSATAAGSAGAKYYSGAKAIAAVYSADISFPGLSPTISYSGNFAWQWVNSSTAHSRLTDGAHGSGQGTATTALNGYLKWDMGQAYVFNSGTLNIGTYRGAGDHIQYTITYSTDDSTYSAWDMSGISQDSILSSDNISNVSGGTAAGEINFAGHSGSGGSVSVLSGVSTITARYIKVTLTAANLSGSGYDANGKLTQFNPGTVATETSAASTSYNDQTLISTTTTASTAPTKASIVLQTEDETGTATINTDVKVGVSRDALNYVDTTLAKIGTWGSGNVYAANDVTVGPGVVMDTKVVTIPQLGSLTDVSSANFWAGNNGGSLGQWSWGSGASSNDVTLANNANEYGGSTDGSATPIVFAANTQFEWHWVPTSSGSGHGPYIAIVPTSYVGNNNGATTTDVIATTGAMLWVGGGSAPLKGLRYNPNGTQSQVNTTDYSGTACKFVRDANNYLKFYSAGVLIYTSTSTHSGIYKVTMSQQGGNHQSYAADLQYKKAPATNIFRIDGTAQATQTLTEGYTYKFDTSDSSNTGHTFKFATAADAAGSTQYTTGVTESGTVGSANAYTQIVVAASAPTLYYYCSNHASMGGTANTPAEAATTSMRYKIETKNQSYTAGSTTITDSSSSGHTVTAVADAALSTTQTKISTKSIFCDGTDDEITVPDSDDWAFAGDYTVEFWVYFNGAPANNAHICGQGGNAASNFAFFCRSEGSGNFVFGTSNGSTQRLINPSANLSNAWHHVALVKYGTSQKLYIDGTSAGTPLTHSEPVQNVSAPWEFSGGNNSASHMSAYWDEIRFSNVARYTANFTAFGQDGGTISSPTAFTSDSNTKLLIRGVTAAATGKITKIHGTSLAWK